MTPQVLRNGPESLVTQPPQRERNSERNSEQASDFAALFGALRRAEPPRQPEPPRHEPPRAAAPAVPDRPIDEAPRAELPAAPEATDKQPPRTRTPRQPAPPGLPVTATGADAASKADPDALMAAAGVADEHLLADSEAAPPAAADAVLIPIAPPAPNPPSSPEDLSKSASDEQAAAPSLDALKQAGADLSAQPTENASAAETAAKPTEPAAAHPLALAPTREAPPKPQQASQEPSGLRGPDALPALPGSQALAPSAANASPAQAALGLPPQHPGFAEELGAQLSVWTRQGVQQAELRLNPAELGPVQVRIQIEGQQAMVRFVADAAPTRDALEAAMPELAAALQREGLQLSGGSVQSQSQHQQQQQQQQAEAAAAWATGRNARGAEPPVSAATPPAARPLSQRLLDLYA